MPLFRKFVIVISSVVSMICMISDLRVARADGGIVPVPNLTIYPGDVIKDEWLEDLSVPANFVGLGSGAVIVSRRELVGKVARHTLLPGRPIPANAVGERKIVAIGTMVKVIFEEGGLSIVTYGAALQAGTVGDIVPIRNISSGLIISGIVQADGSIRVGDS